MIVVKNKKIGASHKPFIIAEMSGNHNHSLDRALQIVEAAAKAGADAIKLQTYTADTMTLNVDKDEFKITDPNSLWTGRHLYELYEEAHTPWEWHKPIMDKAKELGILCFSTPFDHTAVDFLESLEVPAYKIASFENTDVNLIKKVVKTGKPVIVSTGMATLSDLELIVSTIKAAGGKDYVLLKCTSEYPAPAEDANLRTIPHLREMFDCEVGLSDHTMGIGVAVASVALGATVIEKHFTLSRAEGGVDSAFSLEPHELKLLVEESERAQKSLGKVGYGAKSSGEKKSLQHRRSIYFVTDMEPGEVITEAHIRCIRPGFGLEPKYFEKIIGKKVKSPISRGTAASWSLIE
ncbi:MAG: pseudaminic acid synthase [Gammaproteobacteria bacterium]|jgi:N-acetylneuraminate synthase|nr:pseudaminic acid synthase [Gammaproteobacteria bacterium]